MIILLVGALLLVVSLAFSSQGRLSLVARTSPRVAYRLSESVSTVARLKHKLSASRAVAKKRSSDFRELQELADLLVVLERLFAAGDSTLGAIAWLGQRAHSPIGTKFLEIANRVHAGGELIPALREWQQAAKTGEVQDLLTKLISASATGSDVVGIVRNMRRSVEDNLKASQLANLAKSETRMMIPIVFLVLPITILFAVYPSLTLLNLNFN